MYRFSAQRTLVLLVGGCWFNRLIAMWFVSHAFAQQETV